MTNILLLWEKQGPAYIRQIHGKPNWNYGWIIQYEEKFFYHAIRLDNTNIFKPVGAADSDYVSTLEEAKKIVDAALVDAGWKLLNNEDEKLLVLI